MEFTDLLVPIGERVGSPAFFMVVAESAVVLVRVGIGVRSRSVGFVVMDLADVLAPVGKRESSLSVEPSLAESPDVRAPVRVSWRSLSIKCVVMEFTHINVAVWKGAGPCTVISVTRRRVRALLKAANLLRPR